MDSWHATYRSHRRSDSHAMTADPGAHENMKDKASATAAHQLNKLVERVVDQGVGPVTGSVAWAEDRLSRIQGDRYEKPGSRGRPFDPRIQEDVDKTIKRLVRESVEAAGVNGFVTGLGGFIAMPVTIPANMAGALVVNARLAAAIAYLKGYDPKDPHVLTVATLVAVGSNAQQIGKAVGIKLGEKVAMQAIKKIPLAVIRQINKKAGFMLLAKYGTKRSVLTLTKGVPLIGGAVGGAVDATMTGLVGRTAVAMFGTEPVEAKDVKDA